MGGYGYAAAGLVNGEMLPLVLSSIEWEGGLGSPGFYRQATPPGGGSVLYKSERALAAVVQSEVGSVELTSIAVQHSR